MAEDRGLFDIIGSGFNKFVNNPVVQGAAAFGLSGFNPLFGLAAAPFIKDERDRASLRNQRQRDRVQAIADFSDLSTAQVPRTLPRIPLLDVEGRPTRDFVGGVEMRSQTVPELSTPEGQQKALGILSRISPDAVASQLAGGFSATRRPTANIAETDRFIELRDTDPEAAAFLRETSTRSSNPMQESMQRLQQLQLELEMAREARDQRREDEAHEREQKVERLGGENIVRTISDIERSVAGLENAPFPVFNNPLITSERLSMAGLLPENIIQSAASNFGIELAPGQLAAIGEGVQTFDQLTSNALLTTVGTLGARSDAFRDMIARTKPALNISARANRVSLAMMAGLTLSEYAGQLSEKDEAEMRRIQGGVKSVALPLPVGLQETTDDLTLDQQLSIEIARKIVRDGGDENAVRQKLAENEINPGLL
jgi:hypothetical protein